MTDKNLKEQIDGILRGVAEVENITNYELLADLSAETGDGFMGQIYFGSVKDKSNGKVHNVVIKKNVEMPFSDTTFKNEVVFYDTVYPELDNLQKEAHVKRPFNNVPKYYSGSSKADEMYLAMENLKLLNYEMYDKKKFLDEEHLKFIFRLYGKYHALSFVLKDQKPEDYRAITAKSVKVYEEMKEGLVIAMKSSLKPAVDAFDSEEFKIQHERSQKVLDDLQDLYVKSTRYQGKCGCIIHGDCWSNNFFFKYSDSGKLEDMKLIDFQFSHESTPVHDLSYFFYSGASKADFDKLDDYLDIYFRSFTEFAEELGSDGTKLLPFDVLKEEWKTYGLFGLLMGILLWQIKLTDKEQCQEFTEKASEDKGYEQWNNVMKRTHSNPVFKERTTNILKHAVEYGII
ncbi:hypothetical protein GWI33_017502 [Rhynchophorus ferrugineus]|uniref:CHK kinase-like domain-containing protein n=1 Tax=Rhynchophorus ferrugineus TaxID=354439 RepID=A0A834HZM2_RHYFE|nr:hypothetical protein GWI33_017502 [Rhynchophorus ferrugineus]